MHMTKRILSFALVLVMVLSCIPVTALAADSTPALPTASVTEIKKDDLTFALNFKVDPVTQEQLAYYGNWYADFELTINKDVTFNNDGSADGWLAGQYDEYSSNWLTVPFGKYAPVTLKANQTLKIMAFAAEQMDEPGLKYTYKEIYETVRDFDCGVYFDDEFLAANPDLEVKLELKMYNPANESENYVIGQTYTYGNPVVAKNTTTNKVYTSAFDALMDCAEGQTVVMVKNSVENMLYVLEDTTLNLNGYTLVANYVTSYGTIIDTSVDNSGLLEVPANRIMLREKNKQLPVRDGNGYRFVQVLDIATAYIAEQKMFAFQVYFEPEMLELLKRSQEDTEVTIEVKVSWKEANGYRSQNFIYIDEFVQTYLNSYNSSIDWYGEMFTLILDSTDEFQDLTFTAVVVSKTGVERSSADPAQELEKGNVTTNANNQVVNDVAIGNGNASAVVPAGTQLENGANNVTLNATTMEKTTSNITLSDGEQMVSMNVHVDGVAANNTKPIIVTLKNVAPEYLNQGNLALYHVENGVTVEMTRVYSLAEVDAHNEYYYDIATGTVTMALATFSEIAVRSVKKAVWKGGMDTTWYNTTDNSFVIYNADQLFGFSAIVGGMAEGIEQDSFAGKTVTLMADIDLDDGEEDGKIFYPIGYHSTDLKYEKTGVAVTTGFYNFCGTFDGNGNTIANFYQNTWEMKGDNNYYDASLQYYRDGMGLFGKVYGGTVKNLTISNFSSDGEYTTTGVIAAYADCGATFENISITKCNPRVYNIGNGGIVGCVGWYAKEANTKVTFKNITVDNTNKISALWGSWDVACGGILGQYYPTSGQSSADYPVNGGVHFDNCHVAAQIDVYNDVCANYQYYAYRYSGMLIGSVRENTNPDANGYIYPKMDGITATGCTVHFGDWNDYYYCELVANTLASYTHDHQMSRLTQVAAVDVENLKYLPLGAKEYIDIPSGRVNFVVVNGDHATENATCYHFVDRTVWNHKDAGSEKVGEETVLKEDKQHIYLEFNNLVTGYGWGVTSKWVEDVDGVEILDKVEPESVNKFEATIQQGTVFFNNTVITVGDLFEYVGSIPVTNGDVKVFVSPVEENGNVRGTYVVNKDDWKQSTLTLSGTGAAYITITDYFYCNPVTIQVMVNAKVLAKIGETEYTSVQDALDAAQDGDTITLVDDVAVLEYLDIYTEGFGAIERSITLDLNGNTIAMGENYKYQYYPLVFVGINQTLTIKNGSIVADEHIALGVYGNVVLDNVTIESKKLYAGEQTVCIWNWSEADEYYKDCEYLVTGSAIISNTTINGDILVEGPVTLKDANVKFDKLYLNTTTANGKVNVVPNGYGLRKVNDYFVLHKHAYTNGECECGLKISFVLTNLADIKSTDVVVITMTNAQGTTYAITYANGTAKAPTADKVIVNGNTLNGDIAEVLWWNIVNENNELTIYPDGETKVWLYSTNSNDGIRVGVGAAKHFTVDGNYLKITETDEDRYVGVYNNQDWRTYEIAKGYANIQGQTLAFYVMETSCEHEFTEERGEIAPTCAEAGHEAGVYCLTCDTYTEGGALINALSHDFKLTSHKDATCDKDGKNIYHCTVCNKVKTETIKAAHTWVDATCTAPKTCSVCKTTEGEALGHNYGDASCTEAATCTVCGEPSGAALGHDYEGKVTTAATCTTTGVMTYTCSRCEDSYTEEVAIVAHTAGTPVKENEVNATCYTGGSYDTVTRCSACGTELARTTTATEATNEHTYGADGKCTTAGCPSVKTTETKEAWELVTDASKLQIGDTIIIVAKDYNYALSTTQNSNNRGQIAITKDGSYVTIVDGVQVLTLQAGTTNGTFAFHTGSGYLYAASSGSNHLKTQATKDANSSWTISIADGTASIIAKSSTNRNVMQYNQSSSLFACYASASQKALAIYKLVEIEVEGGEGSEGGDSGNTGNTPTTVRFELGANGSASHNDGSEQSTYSATVDGYTLNITGGSKMYTSARDAKGNSCIKLGTNSAAGKFTFTVGDNVTQVVIYIAKYKANTTKIKVNNGNVQTLTKNSDNGEYDAIVIDTTTTKTISLTTVSGGYRAMVNAIEFTVVG